MTTTAPPRKDPHLSKTVRVPNDVYDRLVEQQGRRESLGDVIRRLLGLDHDDDTDSV